MDLSFTALEPGIKAQLAEAKLTKSIVKIRHIVTTNLLPHKERFLAVEKLTAVPVVWLMPVFYREGGGFNAYFGNGDSLSEPTKHVPANRGPFANWEDGAIDALILDHITSVEEWTWARVAYQFELWNGFGPRLHGRPSGYVWSGTSIYQGGKYIADGPGGWSPGTWDQQLGCVAIARELIAQDPTLAAGLVEGNLTS
jgi:lysozyme family protein